MTLKARKAGRARLASDGPAMLGFQPLDGFLCKVLKHSHSAKQEFGVFLRIVEVLTIKYYLK